MRLSRLRENLPVPARLSPPTRHARRPRRRRRHETTTNKIYHRGQTPPPPPPPPRTRRKLPVAATHRRGSRLRRVRLGTTARTRHTVRVVSTRFTNPRARAFLATQSNVSVAPRNTFVAANARVRRGAVINILFFSRCRELSYCFGFLFIRKF